MNSWLNQGYLLAQIQSETAETESFRATEFDLPENDHWTAPAVWRAGCVVWAGRSNFVEGQSVSEAGLASDAPDSAVLLVLLLLVVVMLNPRQRTQLTRVEKSRVGILIGHITVHVVSGGRRSGDISGGCHCRSDGGELESRSNDIMKTLLDDGLLQELAKRTRFHSTGLIGVERPPPGDHHRQ